MFVQWSIPVWVWPLLLPVALLILIWVRRTYGVTEPAVSGALRKTLIGLRSAAFLLLLLAIAGPSLSRLKQQPRLPEVVVVVEDSASMAIVDHRSVVADSAGTALTGSRWALAQQLTTAVDSALSLRQDPPVTVTVLRGNGIEPLREPASIPPIDGAPANVGSDLAGLLRQVNGRYAAEPLQAVILLSDGNETVAPSGRARGRGPVRSAGEPHPFPGGTTSFLAVGLGDPAGPADRLIQDLRYPDVAYAGDQVVVELVVAARYATAEGQQPVTVRLHDTVRNTVVAETTAPSVSDLTRVELSFTPDEPGLGVYRLEVTPLVNERYLDNNQVTLAINVRKQRARVLLLSSRPGWDGRFLAQAALRESRLVLEQVYPAQTGLVFADSLTPWLAPESVAGWRRFDGVVLTGWADALLDFDWQPLVRAVREGLGLWLLPGPGARGPAAPDRLPSALAELLPFAPDPLGWREGDWFLRLAGDTHPALEGVALGPRDGTRQSLATLPPLQQVVPGTSRPGDSVLLDAVSGRGERGAAGVPVLVVGQRGSGRIAWFGGRPLWELAFWELPAAAGGEDQQPARRLLRNLLVWIASGEEESGLGLRGGRTVYQEGERIRLEAQWRDMRGNPVTGRKLFLRVRSLDQTADSPSRTYSMTAKPGDPGAANVVLPPLRPGRYSVRPQSGDETPVVGAESPLVVAASSLEATQVRQDRRRLRQLADQVGGVYVNADAPAARGQLLRRIADLELVGDARMIRQHWDFWAGWPLLAVVALLLGGEWFLRRRHGLM